jgi:hypothetical protein
MKRVIKHELIEVIVPKGSSATRFQLPDSQNLRNVQTWGVQAYYGGNGLNGNKGIIPKSIISNLDVITKTTFQLSFLTLQNYAGREFNKQAPLAQYQTIENNMVTIPIGEDVFTESSMQEKDFKNFVGQKINFPKSFIDTVGKISDDAKDTVFLLSIYYTDRGETFSQTSFQDKH